MRGGKFSVSYLSIFSVLCMSDCVRGINKKWKCRCELTHCPVFCGWLMFYFKKCELVFSFLFEKTQILIEVDETGHNRSSEIKPLWNTKCFISIQGPEVAGINQLFNKITLAFTPKLPLNTFIIKKTPYRPESEQAWFCFVFCKKTSATVWP